MIPRLLSALAALTLLAARLPGVDIGQNAPPLAGAEWIKDVPVALTGMVSVIEFWSTSASSDSFPRLSELQRSLHDRLQIIGISSEAADVVKPFVDSQGGDMDYHVAILGKAAAAAWIGEKDDLPRCFIVDSAGRLAWRGDPADLESMLDRILAGTITTAVLARLAPLSDQIDELIDGDHPDAPVRKEKALDLTRRCLAIDPVNLKAIATRLWLAEQLHQPDIARATLADVPLAQISAADANMLALDRLGAEDPAYRLPEAAYTFALRARTLAPDKAAYHDTYARYLQLAGLLDQAIAEQKSAVALDPEDDALVAMLEHYQALQTLRPRLAEDVQHLPIGEPPAEHAGAPAAHSAAPAPAPAPAVFIP
jgi:hypothetical protein